MAQWNDDAHHAFHVAATGEVDGYCGAFREDPVCHPARCLAEGFTVWGDGRAGSSRHLPATAFVAYLQNHDQVGNRTFGERLSELVEARVSEALTSILLLAPSPALIFMGKEWAPSKPFLVVCDFRDELAEALMTDYTFDGYLKALDTNWFEDDALLQQLLVRYARGSAGERSSSNRDRSDLTAWGERAGGLLRALAEESARVENRPRLRHFDAHGRRVDEVVLPTSTLRALREVEGKARLGAPWGDPFLFYAKSYLYWQNGEAGVACSMACTDGLVRALEALGDGREHRRALDRVRGSSAERVWHGAQFVTEIQGGSDVRANRVRAVADGSKFRLHGQKWFCSNVNADYFLVTARPEGPDEESRSVGLFLAPAFAGDGEPLRNGYTIDRLKEKLGTRELATAEVTFRGALAYPVGPLEHGLANLIRFVLVPSRFACVLSSAAFLRRAERIVDAYAVFRNAFGRRIAEFPLVRETLGEVRRARARALASAFGLLDGWERETEEFRVLLSLAKSVLTRETTAHLHEAMAVLGGNGIEESFSPLPRLYRDSAIMETWEGPHNVLLTQALRDLRRSGPAPDAFVEAVAGPGHDDLAVELEEVVRLADDPETTLRLPSLASALVRRHGERVLQEVDWDST